MRDGVFGSEEYWLGNRDLVLFFEIVPLVYNKVSRVDINFDKPGSKGINVVYKKIRDFSNAIFRYSDYKNLYRIV